MAQACETRARLCAAHGWAEDAVDLVPVTASGDRIQDRPLAEIGGKALWTRELDAWLIDGAIDAAVHSLKDVETLRPAELTIAAILPREDVRDVLLGAATIAALPPGARVGTSAPRRAAQILHARPDLTVVGFRGNVATRIAKLAAGEADATLLAAAGLARLGEVGVGTPIEVDDWLPAPAQGAIGIECRSNDAAALAWLAAIDHGPSRAEVMAERALLSGVGGGCQVPLGALAVVRSGALHLQACACSPDGTQVVRATLSGPVDAPEALGQAVAKALIQGGASVFIRQVALDALKPKQPLAGRTVVVTRSESQGSVLSEELSAMGAKVIEFPTISIQEVSPDGAIPGEASVDWLIFTSVNGVNHFASALAREGKRFAAYRSAAVCAIGPATAATLRVHGVPVSLTPEQYVAESILEALTRLEGGVAGKRFLMPRGNLARPELPDALRAAGAEVTECVVYETVMPAVPEETVTTMLASAPELVVFTSSSTARNFATILGDVRLEALKAKAKFASIGPITTATAKALGVTVSIEPEEHEIPALVYAIVDGIDTTQ